MLNHNFYSTEELEKKYQKTEEIMRTRLVNLKNSQEKFNFMCDFRMDSGYQKEIEELEKELEIFVTKFVNYLL